MSDPCGCCEGVKPVTPVPVANRPGLAALSYRVGTHSSFLETMLARISTSRLTPTAGTLDARGLPDLTPYSALGGLTTRDPSDFSIALLDAWATVADVLTFYQERIANEGYLRTATERRSVVELARLIGYTPKPGVSASAYLAYTVQKDSVATIPAGSRSQSVPGPGQLPQSFETSDPLDARAAWNDLQPRLSRPQRVPDPLDDGHRLFLDGVATKLRAGDPLLVRATPENFYRVRQVTPDAAAGRTTVVVAPWSQAPQIADTVGAVQAVIAAVSPAFAASIQKDVLGPLQASLKSSASTKDIEAAVYRAVRQLTGMIADPSGARPKADAVALWTGLSQTLVTPRLADVKGQAGLTAIPTLAGTGEQDAARAVGLLIAALDEARARASAAPNDQGLAAASADALRAATAGLQLQRRRVASGTPLAVALDALAVKLAGGSTWFALDAVKASLPVLAGPEDQGRAQAAVAALTSLENDLAGLTAASPTSPRDPDLVARFVVVLQTATEQLRVQRQGAATATATAPSLGATVDALMATFTDIVRGLPTAAIWAGLDAIKTVYLPLASALDPTNPTVAIVKDALDGPGGASTIPTQDDPDALAARVRDAVAFSGLGGFNGDTDPTVNSLALVVRAALQEMIVSLEFGPIRHDLRAIIARYTDQSGAGLSGSGPHDTDVDTAIARRALKALDDALAGLDPTLTPQQAVKNLQLTVTQLRTELGLASAGGYPRVEPWLSSLVDDLDAAVQGAAAAVGVGGQGDGGGARGTNGIPAPANPGDTSQPVALNALLKQLLAGPSVPPQDSSRLRRDVGQTFAPIGAAAQSQFATTDVSAQLLAHFDPQLKTSLYPALSNVAVNFSTDPTSVQALRAKAAPFGASAPPINVLQNGTIIGTREWPLASVTILVELPAVPSSIGTSKVHVKVTVIREGRQDQGEGDFSSASAGALTLKESTVSVAVDASANSITLAFTDTRPASTGGGVYETITVTSKGAGFGVTFQDGIMLAADASHLHDDEVLSGQEAEIDYLAVPSALTATAGLSVRDVLPEPPPSASWNVLTLDGVHDQIVPGGWVVIERLDKTGAAALQVHQVVAVATVAEAAFGLAAKATRLTLDGDWLDADDADLSAYRNATVFAQSEALALAQEPYDADVAGDTIELDGLYDGLKSGRWVIVSGERTDIPATGGVTASERAMIRTVKQDSDPNLTGDKLHSYLGLSVPLSYTYKRSSVTVYGNVVAATNGETRDEVLGSGSGAQALQEFTLKQSPLTFVSAPTARGAATTLQVRVNDVLWQEADTLDSLGPLDRGYVTLTDDGGAVTVVFGNGVRGARLPTGRENVTAEYRTGIGQVGNVGAGQISLLVTRPLAVKAVVNPLPATGGADPESRDQARRNIPVSVTALDRLVSVTDFEDFARTFAGIGKASAQRFATGGNEFVHLTVAGAQDIPIDDNSDLLRNLVRSLQVNGDPLLPVVVAPRELITVVLSAAARVAAGYLWEDVSAAVRQALLAAFSFDSRDLGQPLWLSEVYAVIQGVEGVDYVSVKTFGSLPQLGTDGNVITFAEILARIEGGPWPPGDAHPTNFPSIADGPPADKVPAELARMVDGKPRPAQIALMTADVPDTIILLEVPS